METTSSDEYPAARSVFEAAVPGTDSDDDAFVYECFP
jgi:hypothetical protein